MWNYLGKRHAKYFLTYSW